METESIPELPPEAEARLQALISEQQARRADEQADRRARRGLWLTHHWPREYERCAVLGGRHVCRRCLALYPLAIAVMLLSFAGVAPWPSNLDPWLIWVLCVPATLEFLAEKLMGVRYSAKRQVAVTLLVAVALGHGLAYEVESRWSWEFWGPVLVFGSIWFAAATIRAQRTMFEHAHQASLEHGDLSDTSAPGEAPTC